MEHKLHAYTWNVVHRYRPSLVIEACELAVDGRRAAARFDSARSFAHEDLAPPAGAGDLLHDEAGFRVRACFVDHEMPVLAFALEEKERVRVAPDRLRALGLSTGAWLRDLKRAVLEGAAPDTPIALRWRDRAGEHAAVRTVGELSPVVFDVVPGRRIGYVTDLRATPANVERLERLLPQPDLLYIESVFLHADLDHAQRKNHLTARQAGEIARRLRARALVPFHFSPRYQERAAELQAEARAAWLGTPGPAGAWPG